MDSFASHHDHIYYNPRERKFNHQRVSVEDAQFVDNWRVFMHDNEERFFKWRQVM